MGEHLKVSVVIKNVNVRHLHQLTNKLCLYFKSWNFKRDTVLLYKGFTLKIFCVFSLIHGLVGTSKK